MRFIKCMERDLVFTFRLISLKARVFSTSIPHPESPVSTKRDPGNESDSFSPSRKTSFLAIVPINLSLYVPINIH